MGRIQHASPIEQMYDSCCCATVMVKNTFLEVKDCEDLEPPPQAELTRARTAPEGEPRTLTRAVATGLHVCTDTASCASSTDCEAFSRGSSPHAQVATPLAENIVSPLQLVLRQNRSSSCSTTDDEATPLSADVPQLRVRNTFIEAFMPAPPKVSLSRSRSVPLSGTDSSDESDEEIDVVPDYAVSTPTGEDSPGLSSSFPSFGDLPLPVPAAMGHQPVWSMPPMITVPMWMVPSLPSSSASSAPAPPNQSVPRVAPVQEKLMPTNTKVKQESAKEKGSAEADASKRRPAPTASESRAFDLISDACSATLEHRNSSVWALSRKDATSSALVQKAIEIVAEELSEAKESGDEEAWNEANFRVEALIAGLHSHTHTAIEHPHANYVVQKVADLLPTEHIAFLMSELKGKAVWASKHRFGCRTMLRLVRHSTAAGWAGEAAAVLVDELLANATDLSCDKFGNYVIQEVLEHGLPEQVRKLAEMLLNDVVEASGTQHGSRVVEKALRLCAAPQIQVLADELLRNPSAVQNLACSEYGCFVLRALVKSEQHGRRTSMVLRPLHSDLRKTRQGRRLLGPVFGNSQTRS
mmetsp:Transcript_29124/g.67019  ORF Transcript_29124/g.67019 Transcript_29124/m.67019 type:complete len:582 (+) Transcript_29124:103-1848(+)